MMPKGFNDNRGDFSLNREGDWPGLAKLIEECGEVIQVAGKLIATDGETAHWSGDDLAVRLEEELGDLEAAIAFFIDHNRSHLNGERISVRTLRKRALFEDWS